MNREQALLIAGLIWAAMQAEVAAIRGEIVGQLVWDAFFLGCMILLAAASKPQK